MTFSLEDLKSKVNSHNQVVRIVVVAQKGSTPRNIGTSMLVWKHGQAGTIGGGALEYDAVRAAQNQITNNIPTRLVHQALGPNLGQCCGGHVSLLSELFDSRSLPHLVNNFFARSTLGTNTKMPAAVTKYISVTQNSMKKLQPALIENWMIESTQQPAQLIWVWGAGHVGRALVNSLEPLPGIEITWVDTETSRFPQNTSSSITMLPQQNPASLCAHVPLNAQHFILTYSHKIDLDICDGLLKRGFAYAGLIGSATKWSRFHKRLIAIGHKPKNITRINCPIGDPTLGKNPAHIAVGITRDFLERSMANDSTFDE
ncbi:MAG: xanthine dehydrogenase accessory protein XdhC [Aestuariivita sp.]|nr:xanthine dehydrogenase accessory protein XdhC [Aestuariivita sp.]